MKNLSKLIFIFLFICLIISCSQNNQNVKKKAENTLGIHMIFWWLFLLFVDSFLAPKSTR